MNWTILYVPFRATWISVSIEFHMFSYRLRELANFAICNAGDENEADENVAEENGEEEYEAQ